VVAAVEKVHASFEASVPYKFLSYELAQEG